MPKRRQVDDGSDDGSPPPISKKAKGDRASVKNPAKSVGELSNGKDGDGNAYWEIGNKRRVGVSQFNRTTLVNIREYYEAGGELKPGKKGISLSIDQYKALLKAIPALNEELRAQGHEIGDSEPSANGSADGGALLASPKKDKLRKKTKKLNIEVTSDEDDGDDE
ncbi:hypothetical protein OQA88_11302 [Cercophora sp. LCS_1]